VYFAVKTIPSEYNMYCVVSHMSSELEQFIWLTSLSIQVASLRYGIALYHVS
jgi:hypothetical protein